MKKVWFKSQNRKTKCKHFEMFTDDKVVETIPRDIVISRWCSSFNGYSSEIAV